MQFFIDYFTKHHLLHAPHKWFLALLISPAHLAERHYQKKYHLRFEHAKKLFIFDLCLLASIMALLITTAIWFTYKPTVTDLVILSITPSADRVASGDYIAYAFNCQNNSKVTLLSPALAIQLPPGFMLTDAEPKELFSPPARTFNLSELPPGAGGTVSIGGWIYGQPDQEYRLITRLSYQQENRNQREEKIASMLKTLRGSVLQITLKAPDKIVNFGQIPLMVELMNNGQQKLSDVALPFELAKGISLDSIQTTAGAFKGNQWLLSLPAGESAKLTAQLQSRLANDAQTLSWQLTPLLKVNNNSFPQVPLKKDFLILQPEVEFKAVWENGLDKIKPGQTAKLLLQIKNKSEFELKNLSLALPLPVQLVDPARFLAFNHGKYQNGVFAIDKNYSASLLNLKKEQSASLPLLVPIAYFPNSGTDLKLSLQPQLKAEIKEAPEASYETAASAPELKIGTQAVFEAEMRYYTNEGDQLGRGPLPPQTGKETKYWAMIKIANTTSKISNLKFSAILPDYVQWTGKTSVSHGKDVAFDEAGRTVSWSVSSLNPQEKTGIYFELSLTPANEQQGTAPVLLKNIRFSAHDDYINEAIILTAPDLDSSLPTDEMAQKKGTMVK